MKSILNPESFSVVIAMLMGVGLFLTGPTQSPSIRPAPPTTEKVLPTIEQARYRAEILHTTFHGVLQVMHRDFFDSSDLSRIPSASLEDVFVELGETYGVDIQWLGVNAKTMDVDHEASDAFQKAAVKALSDGQKEYAQVLDQRYRRVASIQLHNVCLKCHVPNRKRLEDRLAGLEISMLIQPASDVPAEIPSDVPIEKKPE